MIYDYVIIGAGPCGLTLGYHLSKIGKSVCIIDKNKTIGGCHRVNRVDGLFTEHGPRIYSDSYVNTIKLLKDMNLNFYEMFTPYKIDKTQYFRLKFSEMSYFALQYFIFLIDSQYGNNTPVKNVIKNFSPESKEFIDRLCRLTDGAGSDRYTLNQLLQLFDQNMFYNVYIPKLPNDEGLFKEIKSKMTNVEFLLESRVEDIILTENKIQKIKINTVSEGVAGSTFIEGKKFLFCIPPESLINLIDKLKDTDKILPSNFKDLKQYSDWANGTNYNSYIPITFHWDKDLGLPITWGFPVSDWGIAFNIMSNYMKFGEENSKTVITTCIMYTDKKSQFTGKTANESSLEELVSEVFRQLKTMLNIQENYTKAIPNIGLDKINNIWRDGDTAFVHSAGYKNHASIQTSIDNMYSIGTHNGNTKYHFTTFESAVTNALYALNILEPGKNVKIKSPYSISYFIKLILLILVLVFIFYKFFKYINIKSL